MEFGATNQGIDAATGQGSRGWTRILVTLTGVDPTTQIATCVDQLGKQYHINVNSIVGSGTLPQVGEQWFLSRDLGQWTFMARVRPVIPLVDPTDLSSVVAALVQLGLIRTS